MEIVNTIIYLIGFPGVGKYTIAKKISEEHGFHLIDNHAINNIIFRIVDMKQTPLPEEVWLPIRQIRTIILDTLVNVSPKSLNIVFTNVLCDSKAEDYQLFQTIRETAEKRGGIFVPVRLHCDPHENEKRIVQPDRKLHMKLTDGSKAHTIAAKERLIHIDHPNLLDVDVTNLSVDQATEKIINFVKNLDA